MNKLTAKGIALSIAVCIAVMIVITDVITSNMVPQEKSLVVTLMIALVLSSVSWYLIYLLLSRWMKANIANIRSTLVRLSEKDDSVLDVNPTETDNSDLLSQVNGDVIKWAKEKANEISLLKKTESYRKEYVGNISHELKTPLFNIQGYINILMDGGYDDEEISMKYLERTDSNISRLIQIVKDLEEISKLEVGELKLHPEIFDIVNLANENITFYEMKAQTKNITLRFKDNLKPTTLMVEADKGRIFEVFQNLIVNSINYGKEGGTTEVSIIDIENKVLVEVIDNGIGIAEENLGRVFERFFREDKARSTKSGGTGLGLAIVKHIIECHGEHITVKSKKGEGTTFSFTLKKAEI